MPRKKLKSNPKYWLICDGLETSIVGVKPVGIAWDAEYFTFTEAKNGLIGYFVARSQMHIKAANEARQLKKVDVSCQHQK